MSVEGNSDKEEGPPLNSVYRLHTGAVAKRADELAVWRQGHLIVPPQSLALPLTWVMPPGNDSITGLTSPEASLFSPYFNETSKSLMVVASQTCDVSGADTGKVHPFVMAAPLTPEFNLDPSQVGLAKRNRSPYLVRSSYADEDHEEVMWFADLRLLIPLSKGVLLTCSSGGCVFDSQELILLSSGLGHKFSRAAVDDLLVAQIPRAINDHLVSLGETHQVVAGIEEVRLQVDKPKMGSTGVRVIFIVEPRVVRDAQGLLTGWETNVKATLSRNNFKLRTTYIDKPKGVSAELYRDTSALRIESLGAPRWL